MDVLKLKALEYAMAWLVGPLAMLAMQGLKRGVAAVDLLPAWQKRAVVVLLATGFTLLGQVLGVDFGVTPDSLEGLTLITHDTAKIAVAAALAFALHGLKRVVKK